jgi:hypothetical protein
MLLFSLGYQRLLCDITIHCVLDGILHKLVGSTTWDVMLHLQ